MFAQANAILGRYISEPVQDHHIKPVMRLAWKTTRQLYPAFFFQEIAAREPHAFRVVRDGPTGPVVAFIVAAKQPGRRQNFLLLCIEPSLVGYGIRRALIQQVEEKLRSEGVKQFAVESPVANREMVDFYRSQGFTTITVEPAHVNGIEDRVLLVKDF